MLTVIDLIIPTVLLITIVLPSPHAHFTPRLSETAPVQSVCTYSHITLSSLTIHMGLEGIQSILGSKNHRPLLLPLPYERPSDLNDALL